MSERAGGDGIVNVFENVIGLDLDGDGDVGVHSPAKKASRRAVRADAELSKLVARDKSASLWSELSAPDAKSLETTYLPSRAKLDERLRNAWFEKKLAHSAWRKSMGIQVFFFPPVPPPPPPPFDYARAARWILYLPIFNALWAKGCGYTPFTMFFAYALSTTTSFAYLLTPVDVEEEDDEKDQDKVKDESDEYIAPPPTRLETIVAFAKAHHLLPSGFELQWWLDRVHQASAVLIQLALGGTCIFGFVCLYTEPSTFLGAMSTIMLSTVGLVDTADFLGKAVQLRVLLECSASLMKYIEGEEKEADGSTSAADEVMHSGIYNALDKIANPRRRAKLIPQLLIRCVSKRTPCLLPLLQHKEERKMRRIGFARKPRARVGCFRIAAWCELQAEILQEWWEQRRGGWWRSFLLWFNDIGCEYFRIRACATCCSLLTSVCSNLCILADMVRTSPAKMFVTMLDMYGLVSLAEFLVTHVHTVFLAIANSEGLYWFTPGVQASVLGVVLTYISSTDYVAKYVKPEEYQRRRLIEEARVAVLAARAKVNKMLKAALRPPIEVAKLEAALEAANEADPKHVTPALVEKVQKELLVAIERDARYAKGRDEAMALLWEAMEKQANPFDSQSVALLARAISRARYAVENEKLEGQVLIPAETRMVMLQRALQQRTDTLRRLLEAAGEDVSATLVLAKSLSASQTFEVLLKRHMEPLLQRTTPPARTANRALLKVLKRTRESGMAAVASNPVPAVALDLEVLESAIAKASEITCTGAAKREIDKMIKAARMIGEDQKAVGIDMDLNAMAVFAKALRARAWAGRERNCAAKSLQEVRDAVSHAHSRMRLTKQHTIPLLGALEDLERTILLSESKEVPSAVLAPAKEEHAKVTAFIERRELAKARLERARERGADIVLTAARLTQPELEENTSQLEDAIRDAEKADAPVAQDALYDLHDKLVSMVARRAKSIERLTNLMAEFDRADETTIGINGYPVPELRAAISSAKACSSYTPFVADIERRALAERLPWSQIRVQTAACAQILPDFEAGTVGTVASSAEFESVAAAEAAVKAAMAPLHDAFTGLRSAMDTAGPPTGTAGPPGGMQTPRAELLSDAVEVVEQAEIVWHYFFEMQTRLVGLKALLRNTVHYEDKKKAAKKYEQALLEAISWPEDRPPLPPHYVSDAREVIKPLYRSARSNSGFFHQPLLNTAHIQKTLNIDISRFDGGKALSKIARERALEQFLSMH